MRSSKPSKGVILKYGIQRLYHCKHCNQAFTYRQNMYRHQRLHIEPGSSNYAQKGGRRSGSSRSTSRYILSSKSLNQTNRKKPQYPCDLCGDIFASNWSLQHHIQQQHSEETPYKCRTCQKPYASRDSMISHMATHDPRTYFSCPFCPDNGALGFSKRGDLTRHFLRRHPGVPKSRLDSILATRPKFTWREPSDLDDDINEQEEIDEPIMPKLEPFDEYDQDDYNSDANSSFPNFNQGGEDDGQNQVPGQEVEDVPSIPRGKIIELWPERKSLPHKCRICGKGFAFIQNKKRHEGFHGNPGSLVNSMLTTRGINIKDKISKVMQTIPRRTNAPKSMKRMKKRVNCKYCGKTLSDIWNLRNHIQAFHSTDMNFKCVHCSKPYASKDSLRKHEAKHFMKNPPIYRCPPKLDCNAVFEYWDDYVMHYEVEHPNERLPEEIRSKAKSNMIKVSSDEILQELGSEVRNGEPICDICGQKLKNWPMVQRHKKAIHGLRPFKCRYCPKRFGLTSSRTNHEQTHIGKRSKLTAAASSERDSTPSTSALSDVLPIDRSIKVEYFENSPNLENNITARIRRENTSPQKKRGWSDEDVPVRSMKGKPFRCPNCHPGHSGFISLCSLRVHFTRFPDHVAEDSVIEQLMVKGGGGGVVEDQEAKKFRENLAEILPNIEFEIIEVEVEAREDEEDEDEVVKLEEVEEMEPNIKEDDLDVEPMIPKIKMEEEDAEPLELDNVENTKVREMEYPVIEIICDDYEETDEEKFGPASTKDNDKEGGTDEEMNRDAGQVDYFFYTIE